MDRFVGSDDQCSYLAQPEEEQENEIEQVVAKLLEIQKDLQAVCEKVWDLPALVLASRLEELAVEARGEAMDMFHSLEEEGHDSIYTAEGNKKFRAWAKSVDWKAVAQEGRDAARAARAAKEHHGLS